MHIGRYSATRDLEDGEEIGIEHAVEGKAGLNWDAKAVDQLSSCSPHPGGNQSILNLTRERHL